MKNSKQQALSMTSQKKTVKIWSKIEAGLKEKLVNCLRAYANVFAWSHDDMPGIDPTISYYKLAIRKYVRLVKQKRRFFNQKRYDAISAEVEKLLRVGFKREVEYPNWVSNVVLMKMSNGK